MALLFLCHADDAQSAEDCCHAIYLSEVAGPHLDGAILWGSEDVMLSNDTSDASAVDLHRHTTHSLTATDQQQTTTPPPQTPCLWPSVGNGTINNTTTNTVLLKSDMDYRTFNMGMWSFCMHGEAWFIVSSEGPQGYQQQQKAFRMHSPGNFPKPAEDWVALLLWLQ